MEVRVYNYGNIGQILPMLCTNGGEIHLTIYPEGYVIVEQKDILYNKQQMEERSLVIIGNETPVIPEILAPVEEIKIETEQKELEVEEEI